MFGKGVSMSQRVITDEVLSPRRPGPAAGLRASAAVAGAWALLFAFLAALPGLVAVGVGFALVDVLTVSSVTGGCLFAAALMLGGFPRGQ